MIGETPSNKGISFITMGCAKNEVDTAHMTARLRAAGYCVIDDVREADAIVVNTCSFIQAATEESIEAILDAAGLENVENGSAHLVVAGCMPARYGDELESELPEVSRFISCEGEEQIVSLFDELFGVERAGGPLANVAADFGSGSVSAYVKISDGCDRFCSYCTIPFIRGRYRSFPEEEIEREASSLIAGGAREIILIAQDTGRWGDDLDEPMTLAELIEGLARRHRDTWFRVMYIQPEGITDELVRAIAENPNICSYLDIPFQHCDADLLRRMNRTGSAQSFLELVSRLRDQIPDVTLRTTLIAGFPGETDEQFDALCEFVEEAELDYVGVFPYSREEGTRAASLDGQIDEDEKLERAQRLRDVADAVSSSVVSRRIGREMDVLVCGEEEDGQLFGRAMCQAPDVDGVTYLEGGDIGSTVRVVIEDTLLYEMEGAVAS